MSLWYDAERKRMGKVTESLIRNTWQRKPYVLDDRDKRKLLSAFGGHSRRTSLSNAKRLIKLVRHGVFTMDEAGPVILQCNDPEAITELRRADPDYMTRERTAYLLAQHLDYLLEAEATADMAKGAEADEDAERAREELRSKHSGKRKKLRVLEVARKVMDVKKLGRIREVLKG